MSEKNTVKIFLNGAEFIIKAEEDKDYIERISKIVDSRIMEVLNTTQNTNIYMATVVTALNYCDELVKEKIKTQDLSKELDNIEKRYKEKENHIKENNKKLVETGLELEKFKSENEKLNNQIDILNLKVAHLQNDLNDYIDSIKSLKEIEDKNFNSTQTTVKNNTTQNKSQKINVRVVNNKKTR